MKLKWKLVAFGALLSVLGLASWSSCQAATVWSEDFNGGVLPPDWTVYNGGFSCSGFRLEGHSAEEWNDATHDSSVAVGTWSFDADTDFDGLQVFFMASDLNPGADYWPDNGYALAFWQIDQYWSLFRQTNGGFSPLKRSYEHTDGPVSVVITRNSTGYIHIWIENDLVMEQQDATHSSSEYFFIGCQEGVWIDNIVVSNTIDKEREDGDNGEPPPPPQIPGFPTVALAFGFIAALTLGLIVKPKKAS